MIDSLLSSISPHICKGCGAVGKPLCNSCYFDIINEKYLQCIACGEVAGSGSLCRDCRENGVFDEFFCVGERAGILKRLVGDFKFNSERAAAKSIALVLDATLPHLTDNFTIVPIPTIAPHIRQRGFDHTKLVAKNVAKLRKVPAATSLLERQSNSVQHGLSARDRRIAAQRAFAVAKNRRVPENVILFDDIYTTGATLTEAAKKLRAAGVKKIYGLVVCRQIDAKKKKSNENC